MKHQAKKLKTSELLKIIDAEGVDSISQINREFRCVFQPKEPELYGKRRFCVGIYSLWKYIGRDNANTVIRKAFSSGDDSYTKLFRKYGRVDFYKK